METPTVWIADSAMQSAMAGAEHNHPYETGGVLMGWHSTVRAEYVVTELVGPGPNATHRLTSFTPDAAWQERRIAELYARRGRRLSYLGDWHTHPCGPARPSRTDIRTLRRIARTAAARIASPLMVVFSGDEVDWSPQAWRLSHGLWRGMLSTVEEMPLRTWTPEPNEVV